MTEPAAAPPPKPGVIAICGLYLAIGPLVGGVVAVVMAMFGDDAMRPQTLFSDPMEILGLLFFFYIVGAVPALLNGMIVGLVFARETRFSRLCPISGVIGAALFSVIGLQSDGAAWMFAVVGAVAGAALGAVTVVARRRAA